MSKWIDFTIDERKAMVQKVAELMHIDEAAAEKDWWVTEGTEKVITIQSTLQSN